MRTKIIKASDVSAGMKLVVGKSRRDIERICETQHDATGVTVYTMTKAGRQRMRLGRNKSIKVIN